MSYRELQENLFNASAWVLHTQIHYLLEAGILGFPHGKNVLAFLLVDMLAFLAEDLRLLLHACTILDSGPQNAKHGRGKLRSKHLSAESPIAPPAVLEVAHATPVGYGTFNMSVLAQSSQPRDLRMDPKISTTLLKSVLASSEHAYPFLIMLQFDMFGHGLSMCFLDSPPE